MFDLYMFDLGNVLLSNVNIVPCIKERLGDRADEFERLYNRYVNMLMTGNLSSSDFWAMMSGVPVEVDLLGECFSPTVDYAVEQCIRQLKERGVRVVCATNTCASHYEIFRNWDCMKYFDCIYASHSMGCAKPDVQFFEFILDAEDARNKKVFFTDDIYEHIEAAKSCGIESFQFMGLASILSSLDLGLPL